ncbi:uncharacterized protein LOC127241195 [Andrographis paniculata]|uniref:uncharacterized protein LOC127241195 n=1 Tax=Andrographis paniculata TaxID=175694 RepID=UPI0021E89FD3|nr:uncharacterized protein LOC127241195 [Andrographis paniculata]
MQLQRVPELQNEVLTLTVSRKEAMSEAQVQKGSFKSLSEEYEKLKRERVAMVEKLSYQREVQSEAELCRMKKNALEEKVLRLEGDLMARDQVCVQKAEMRHELSRMQISNSQLLMKVKQLEEVREHLQSKLQFCEDGTRQSHRKSNSETWCSEYYRSQTSDPTKVHNHNKVQRELQEPESTQFQIEEKDYESTDGLTMNEAGEAQKAESICEVRVQAIVSKEAESRETSDDAEAQQKILLLEAELQEIQDRYLQMSLKYAQAEARREGLVMKLKALST